MSYTVTQENILSVSADAAVLAVEIGLESARWPSCLALEQAGGETLHGHLREKRFLAVGSAVEIPSCALPYGHLFLVCAPHWLTGKANELLALRRCYQNLFQLALEAGCRSLVMPFLSALYYRFPQPEALYIAMDEASKNSLSVTFTSDTPELFALSKVPYRKPEILSYVGWYRDYAIFGLDNGLFARVDLRPENRTVDMIPYFEACYRRGTDPSQPDLPEEELRRLRALYEAWEI